MQKLPERLKLEEEALKRNFDGFSFMLRVASPGIIGSFDSTTQTVSVRLAIKEKISLDGEFQSLSIPVLEDIPLVIPRAGGYSLTLPVQSGDECLVIFGDTCIDSWWQSGGTDNEQMSLRRHDLSDGFAILGTWSQPNLITDYSEDSVELRNDLGTKKVKISETTIEVENGQSSISVGLEGIEIDSASVKINGVEFATHIHSGVTSGGETTGGVVI